MPCTINERRWVVLKRRLFASLAAAATMAAVVVAPGAAVATSGGNGEFHTWNNATLLTGSFAGDARMAWADRPAVTLRQGATAGSWTTPVLNLAKPANQVNPSWQTSTPSGSHIEVQLKVRLDGSWSGWYELGKWGMYNTAAFQRTSVNDQSDAYGAIYTDTYNAPGTDKISAYQMRVKLVSETGAALPKVYQLAAQSFTPLPFSGTVSKTTMTRQVDLGYRPYSQYLHSGEYAQYGGGGAAWCSPTSVQEDMSYWHVGPTAADIAALPPDPVFDANGRVDGAVDFGAVHTYDLAYDGTGNWPFSTALPAEYGLDSAVEQTPDLRHLEWLVKHGVPVAIPIYWDNTDSDPNNDLPGAGIPKAAHLMAIGGFTANGDVIAYDPATHNGDSDVRRIYSRFPLERDWQNANGGIFYYIGGPVR